MLPNGSVLFRLDGEADRLRSKPKDALGDLIGDSVVNESDLLILPGARGDSPRTAGRPSDLDTERVLGVSPCRR